MAALSGWPLTVATRVEAKGCERCWTQEMSVGSPSCAAAVEQRLLGAPHVADPHPGTLVSLSPQGGCAPLDPPAGAPRQQRLSDA